MTHSDFLIRYAAESDADALAELAATAFRDAYCLLDDPADIDEYISRELTRDRFAGFLNDPASVVLLALDGQRFLGYAHIKRSVPPPGVTGDSPVELSRLYLRQDVVGKGIGAALMNAVLREVQRFTCDTLWLAVYDRNLRARKFYARWGFVDVGEKEFLFGGKLYYDPVMSLRIGSQ